MRISICGGVWIELDKDDQIFLHRTKTHTLCQIREKSGANAVWFAAPPKILLRLAGAIGALRESAKADEHEEDRGGGDA